MAQFEPRGAGQVLREGTRGEAEAHANVPALERQGQLQIRPEEEEAEEGQDRRPRLIFFCLIITVALAEQARAGQVLLDGQGGEAGTHADVPGLDGQR